MNSTEPGPSHGELPETDGPVLVMPPRLPKPSKWHLWRARMLLAELIFVCFLIGIILIVAPWTPFWTNNSLLEGFPQLRQFLTNDFVRGLVSGLGLADIWVAVSEALEYRESVD